MSEFLNREIPASNVSGLVAEVEKLNKRAAKLNLPPLVLTIVSRRDEVKKDEVTGVERTKSFATVMLSGESPKLNGWSLVARVTPAEHSPNENFVRAVPGVEVPVEFRSVSMGRCDHCHTNRHRADTFVIAHDYDGHRVVGRNCLGDFLGHASPEALLRYAELVWSLETAMDEAEDEFWGGGGGYHRWSNKMSEFLETVAIWVRKIGWVPRSAANEFSPATADSVWSYLHPVTRDEHDAVKRFARNHELYVSEGDVEVSAKALEWARNLTPGNNDYLYNLKLASKAEVVTHDTIGLVASLIPAYKRHVEKELEFARRNVAKRRGHVGVEDERRGFPNLTITKTMDIPSMYGTKTLVVFDTPEGDIVKWWATATLPADWVSGKVVSVTATVKEHGEYKGVKETTVTRASEGIDPKKFSPETGDAVPKKTRKRKSPESVNTSTPDGANESKEVKVARRPKPEGFTDFTVEPGVNYDDPKFAVYGHGVYPRSSVLAGRERRTFIDGFDTEEAALAAYPYATPTCSTKNEFNSGDPGPFAPADFDPTFAGERWDNDY